MILHIAYINGTYYLATFKGFYEFKKGGYVYKSEKFKHLKSFECNDIRIKNIDKDRLVLQFEGIIYYYKDGQLINLNEKIGIKATSLISDQIIKIHQNNSNTYYITTYKGLIKITD